MKLLLFLLLGWSLHAPGNHRVGFVDADLFPQVKPMAAVLETLDFPFKDLTPSVQKGVFALNSVDILVLTSYCAMSNEVRSTLEKSGEALRSFIEEGGCLIVFGQRVLDRPSESWLPDGCNLLRTRAEQDEVGHVNRDHPVFSKPNAISHRRIARDWTSMARYAVSFRDVRGGAILAARNEANANPWCVEYQVGKGRAIFFACAPELKACSSADRNEDRTKAVTLDLIENTLAYAVEAVEGRAAPMTRIQAVAGDGKEPPSAEKAVAMEVNRAVDAGVAFLKGRQHANGTWPERGHRPGVTALALLALIGSGVNPYDPCIEKGFASLLKKPFSEESACTYDTALIMMALDARAAPVNERFELMRLSATERKNHVFKRILSEDELAFMAAARDWLIDSRTPDGWWSYGGHRTKGDGDLSNTQFAVMGLNAAARCGIKVPRAVWTQVLNHLIKGQAGSGTMLTLPVFRKYRSDSDQPLFNERHVNARSWGYTIESHGEGATGSRTCMGVASLLIAFEGLVLSTRNESMQPSGALKKAILDGLGWLHHHWSVACNPLPRSGRGGGEEHYYYYMYGIERTGVKLDSRYIGDHDWYHEGAAQLLQRQDEDGSWGGEVDTSFALMFLKRSTPPPVFTVGR
jgi:hypothetical protein